MVIKQLRASGGIWISYRGTNVLIDPGPGSIVRCAAARPKLDPTTLDGIILTHKHLDHANDINVMIEAMTEGGFKKRGVVFCPGDALDGHSVISGHVIGFPQKITVLKSLQDYRIGEWGFSTSMKHIHPVETYGLKFSMGGKTVGLLTDTRYFEELTSFYSVDVLIMAVVFLQPREDIDHFSMHDVEKTLSALRPQKTILTHFGMTMVKAKPTLQARMLSARLGVDIQAAYDGMSIQF